MLELTEWFLRAAFPAKPWLVLGKGPTFDRRDEFDLGAYNLIALNHVVDVLHVDVEHAIDIDVIEDCADRIAGNCDWLLVPRYPHVKSTLGTRALEDYFDEIPVLRELSEQDRLVWYNLSHTPIVGDSPVIGASRFSSEAVLNVLGRMGVTTVRSLGVDGGRSYAPSFASLEETTLLTNGALDFHLQFELLEVIAEEHGLDFRPLVEPLKVFVGADESQLVEYRVLEYSIQRAASIPVEVTPMFAVSDRKPHDREQWAREVPALCEFRGRALYLDADTLVLGDVGELARLPAGAAPVRGTVAMLLDCERLGPDAAPSAWGQRSNDDLPDGWSGAGAYVPDQTKAVRFDAASPQPWRSDGHPLDEVWMALYREAVHGGAVPPEEVEAAIAGGRVKPSLRAGLRLAPSRRSAFTSAARDLNSAQRRVAALEEELDAMRCSLSWRLGHRIVRSVRLPGRVWRARGSRTQAGTGSEAVGGASEQAR
jgi:hypothetical protein